jgi:hypothetical protein
MVCTIDRVPPPADQEGTGDDSSIGNNGSSTPEGDGHPFSDYINNNIPGDSNLWSGLATGADIIALLLNVLAAGVVTFGGIFGAGVPLIFMPQGAPEVNVVTGWAGVAIAELYVQPILGLSNGLIAVSTAATFFSETKNENTIIEEGKISSDVLNSSSSLIISYFTPEAYLSTIEQSVSVANDLNWISFPYPEGRYNLPFIGGN